MRHMVRTSRFDPWMSGVQCKLQITRAQVWNRGIRPPDPSYEVGPLLVLRDTFWPGGMQIRVGCRGAGIGIHSTGAE
jgi:hypothetical protein